MLSLLLVLFAAADVDTVDSKDFPKDVQVRAVTATVRVQNPATETQGSGVLLRRSGPHLYLLTAAHVVGDAARVEVATFTADSFPKPAAVYRSAEVVARAAESDLAVVRVATRDALPGSLPLCPASDLPTGKDLPALSVGCVAERGPSCLVETLRGVRRLRKPGAEASVRCWEAGRAGTKGRSGGPLLDRRGRVLGLASGSGDGKAYYTHRDEILTFLRKNGLEWLAEDPADKTK